MGRLKTGDISQVVYKPTGNMRSDYFTIKALQGQLFYTLIERLWWDWMELTYNDAFYKRYKCNPQEGWIIIHILYIYYYIFFVTRTFYSQKTGWDYVK